jgi:aspartate/methionine/tyrosine aminotransferase
LLALDRTTHLRAGANQYAPMPGVPALREAIGAKVAAVYGRTVDSDTEVTVCTGATEGLFSAIQAVVRPDDEVIVFDPAYDSYEPAITLAGGITRHLPLVVADSRPDFHIDFDRWPMPSTSGRAWSSSISRRTRPAQFLSPATSTRLAGILRDSNATAAQ